MSLPIHLAGQKYGRLTAEHPLKKRDRHGRMVWKCRCDCGKTVNVRGCDLRSGNTKSCGCFHKDQLEGGGADLTGQRFGRLVAIRLLPKRNRRGLRIWLCRCDCGTEKAITANDLFSTRTKSCGCLRNENRRNPKVRRKTAKTLQHLSQEGWVLTCDGKRWYSRRAALQLLGISQTSLEKWAKGSVFLKGQGLAVAGMKSPAGKVENYYLEEDLFKLLRARATFVSTPPPAGWYSREEAQEKTGLGYDRLKKLASQDRIKRHHAKAKDAEGKICRRVFFPPEFIDRVCRKRQRPEGVAVAQAAETLKKPIRHIYYLIEKGRLQTLPGAFPAVLDPGSWKRYRGNGQEAVPPSEAPAPAPAVGTNGQATTTGQAVEQQAGNGVKRRGRRPCTPTAIMYQECYELMKAGQLQKQIIHTLDEKYGHDPDYSPPKTTAHVSIYAKRHAQANKLPWPISEPTT